MNSRIYDWTGERTPDRYIKATQEILTYVGAMYTRHTHDITEAVETLELTDLVQPEAPNPANIVEFQLWKLVVKEHQAKAKEYANFKVGLYNLVYGQCTDALQE